MNTAPRIVSQRIAATLYKLAREADPRNTHEAEHVAALQRQAAYEHRKALP